jgi:hypothetical protein
MNTQKVRLLKYLQKYKSITTQQAMSQLGILRLSQRIIELEEDGVKINHLARVKVKNLFGEDCYVTKYVLKSIK